MHGYDSDYCDSDYCDCPFCLGQRSTFNIRRNPDVDLGLAAVMESGVWFETGKPVNFSFMRNTVPSPKIPWQDDMYQQKLEPAGRFMIHSEDPYIVDDPSGRIVWETGEMTFIKPIVLYLNTEPDEDIYGAHSWKVRLADHFGATGLKLSRILLAEGYDGIVTVDPKYGTTTEIVDLSPARHWRRNPDNRFREIERQALAGDPEAIRRLPIERVRAGITPKAPTTPEEAYGAYTFHALHHDSADIQHVLQGLQNIIETGETPWLYGLAIDNIPAAREAYLARCAQYGIEPEACDW